MSNDATSVTVESTADPAEAGRDLHRVRGLDRAAVRVRALDLQERDGVYLSYFKGPYRTYSKTVTGWEMYGWTKRRIEP